MNVRTVVRILEPGVHADVFTAPCSNGTVKESWAYTANLMLDDPPFRQRMVAGFVLRLAEARLIFSGFLDRTK